jgi:amidase
LAKTNMHELSGFKGPFRGFPGSFPDLSAVWTSDNAELDQSDPGMTQGWSAMGGQTSSAYVFGGFKAGGNPLGSSSGSAVGLSAGWGLVALGTDTTGSTVSRAA